MGLRSQAHADLAEIFGDTADGFDEITITSPAGSSDTFACPTTDIYLSMDPGTGITIAGQQASAVVLISELITAGFDSIRGVSSTDSKPWTVDYTDINGRSFTFKVVEANPDNEAGLNVLTLEAYTR